MARYQVFFKDVTLFVYAESPQAAKCKAEKALCKPLGSAKRVTNAKPF
jgi:hypothetical protein